MLAEQSSQCVPNISQQHKALEPVRCWRVQAEERGAGRRWSGEEGAGLFNGWGRGRVYGELMRKEDLHEQIAVLDANHCRRGAFTFFEIVAGERRV